MSRSSWGAIRQLPHNKRYQASYMGPDSKRHNAPDTFRNKSDAQAWLASKRTEIANGSWQDPSNSSEPKASKKFGEYAIQYISLQTNHKGELLRESTKAVYERQLQTHFERFMSLDVCEIKKIMIDNWYMELSKQGKVTTASKVYKLMNAIMKRAIDDGIRTDNPCKIRGASNATTGRKVSIPSADELNRIAEVINPRYRELILLAGYGGLRWGEVTELRRKDVERRKEDGVSFYVLHISRAVTLCREKFIVNRPKSTSGTRAVRIPTALTPILDRYMLSSVDAQPEALLFKAAEGGRAGEHLRHDVFYNSWRPAIAKVFKNPEGITFHSLRHFGGTNMHQSGAPMKELMSWLGDSSITAVERYLHANNRIGNYVERMDVGSLAKTS